MKRIVLISCFLFLTGFLYSQEVIEKIEIKGNDRVNSETIFYYLSVKEGDYYDVQRLRADFRVLWATGFFSYIRMEEENGNNGKIIKIFVRENPIIKAINYKSGKKVKEDDVIEKLKEEDVSILPYSYYNPVKIKKIEQVIRDLLLEKGLPYGKVTVETKRIGKNEVELNFHIDEGPKVRVGAIEFESFRGIPSSILRSAMKEIKRHGIISWISGKDVFSKSKLKEDLENIKKKLQELGFMEAAVGEPKIEEIEKRTFYLKKQKMVKVVIPIKRGPRYRLGEIKFEGNKAFSDKILRQFVKLKEGEIYNTKKRDEGIEEIQKIYGYRGYFYFQIYPAESLDPKRRLVNLTLVMRENDLAYLGRLTFKGNTYTKDKVLRREFLLREGDRFSTLLFENSLMRMKQLGLVDFEKMPDVKPEPKDYTKIDVTVHVKELQRQNIQFTAGYSGYEGTFVALSYSTVNFLGTGENFEITLQTGTRSRNYSFSFAEPYFLDYPITIGGSIYDRRIVMPYLYTRKGKGFNLVLGGRVKGFWRTSLTYGYELVSISDVNEDFFIGSWAWLYYPEGERTISSLSGTVYRSTIDSPINPTRGTMYLASLRLGGTFLGGDISFIKPRAEWTWYQPIRKHVIGFHIEAQYAKPLEGQELPFWERFYLGGERSIRGFEIYSIGPRNEKGANIGGDKSLVFNAEYIIPVGGPLNLIFFYDVGNVYAIGEKIDLSDIYSSTGIEARIFVPALRIPFRLIFAYNPRTVRPTDSHYAIRFAVGTTF
ncbi:MAG: outer membrane protein assembly factor BamA [Candidatus Aminicenantia bacterium]